MHMDPSDVVDFTIFIGEENYALGTIHCRKGCTHVDIHCEIVNDEIAEYHFDFIIRPTQFPSNAKQEQKKKPTTTNVGIKRKVRTLVLKHCNHM